MFLILQQKLKKSIFLLLGLPQENPSRKMQAVLLRCLRRRRNIWSPIRGHGPSVPCVERGTGDENATACFVGVT